MLNLNKKVGIQRIDHCTQNQHIYRIERPIHKTTTVCFGLSNCHNNITSRDRVVAHFTQKTYTHHTHTYRNKYYYKCSENKNTHKHLNARANAAAAGLAPIMPHTHTKTPGPYGSNHRAVLHQTLATYWHGMQVTHTHRIASRGVWTQWK